jgi:radical SAM superfamily enzyme YgiQ (UPF0313 family)
MTQGNAPQRRLLLSSVCQPFGVKFGDGFGSSYEGSHQIMWAQGIFRTRGVTTQWGIDFIAENLQIPTTTLHYPTMRKFVEEVRKGYDYIGIAFIAATMHKMIPMVQAIRREAPSAKIILGGYGTALGEESLAPYADHICQGEGVSFMRELLGERPDAPIVQPTITQLQSLFSLPVLSRTGYVFAGLGCPNGCDFCATSHYFKRRHIPLLPDGPSILGAMERLRELYPGMDSFWVNDEDFLLDEGRGRGFLEAIRRSSLPPLSLSIFSSVKALSRFSAVELVEMGVDWVWVGFEGQRAGYAKQRGRSYGELITELHQHGISVLASMIIGFDYQTPAIIEEEFEELLSFRPSMSQFLIYGPAFGTPLFERMKREGRLVPHLVADASKRDGFSLVFEHPTISGDEMSAIQRRLYREEFERLGPSIFRVADDWLAGHLNLRDHAVPRVRQKALKYGKDAHPVLKIIPASKRYLSSETGEWLSRLEAQLAAETGPMSLRERLAARLLPAALRYTDFKLRHEIGQQPEFTRRAFRPEPRARRSPDRSALAYGMDGGR